MTAAPPDVAPPPSSPPPSGTPPRRRLVHRLPLRVRQYWRLLALCALVVAVLVGLLGQIRVRPVVLGGGSADGEQVTADVAGTVDLFDTSVPHTIEIALPQDRYERMLEEFFAGDGDKQWVEADVVLDGTRLPSVGLRLKGNSTLRSLTWEGATQRTGRGGPGGSLDAAEPETLPWLLDFDAFVDGRRYQGVEQVTLRVGGFTGSSTVAQEAVALETLAGAGEVTERWTYADVTVNDRPTTARLVVEVPGAAMAERLGGDGVLYKALAQGSFTDQGDDPTAYADDVQQVTRKGSQDLQPVIDLIRWVTTASDAEFAADLDEHVDVASFARYAAAQNLLLNGDDMAGPGRNYYLWYDLGTRRFRVVGWDYNLALTGDATLAASEQPTIGGFGGVRGFQDGGRGGTAGDGGQGGPAAPPGGVPPGGVPPAGVPPAGVPPAGVPPAGGGGPGGGFGGHLLKERFLAAEAFADDYARAYRDLYAATYGDGTAARAVGTVRAAVLALDGVPDATAASDTDRLATLVDERRAALADDPVVTGEREVTSE